MGWADRAGEAHRLLVDRFWDGRRAVFRVAARRRLFSPPHWHYWWQAHALDALVDAVARENDDPPAAARERVKAFVAGILRRNGGRIINDYYDDMAWMALALLRADELAGVDTRPLVRELWTQIKGGWDEENRGIVWRRGDTYTNTPANAPSAVLAARLYRRDQDPTDLEWALAIDDWLHSTLVDPESGLVWDGVHPQTDPGPSRELYTYNQGTVVGASVELYRVTGRPEHLTRAVHTATATTRRMLRPADGLLPDEGSADGGLFKGILVRYLGEFVLVGSTVAALDGPHPDIRQAAAQLADVLRSNAAAVARAAGAAPVGPDWGRPSEGAASLSTHLSAVLLLETLARMEAAGVVAGPPAAPP